MNIKKLRGKMVENDISVEQLADHLGYHHSTMYRKLNEPENITIGDALKIKDYVSLSTEDAVEIFLT